MSNENPTEKYHDTLSEAAADPNWRDEWHPPVPAPKGYRWAFAGGRWLAVPTEIGPRLAALLADVEVITGGGASRAEALRDLVATGKLDAKRQRALSAEAAAMAGAGALVLARVAEIEAEAGLRLRRYRRVDELIEYYARWRELAAAGMAPASFRAACLAHHAEWFEAGEVAEDDAAIQSGGAEGVQPAGGPTPPGAGEATDVVQAPVPEVARRGQKPSARHRRPRGGRGCRAAITERQLEYLTAWLACGRNYSAAGARLGLHHSTVRQQVRAAIQKLGVDEQAIKVDSIHAIISTGRHRRKGLPTDARGQLSIESNKSN